MQSDYRHHTKLRFCLVRIRNLGHRPMEALLLKLFVLSAFQAFCVRFKIRLLGFSALRNNIQKRRSLCNLYLQKKKTLETRDDNVNGFQALSRDGGKFLLNRKQVTKHFHDESLLLCHPSTLFLTENTLSSKTFLARGCKQNFDVKRPR